LLDRIDLHIEVPAVRYQDMRGAATGDTSAAIRQRVAAARAMQQARFAGNARVACNAAMGAKEMQRHAAVEAEAQDLLKMAMTELNFSARAYDRVIKVARTIADMAGAATIGSAHISEAIQYRTLDRNLWV
jgi:magnesium chelatase family protein